MNLEALFVVGAVTLIVGAVLFLLGRLWIKATLGAQPNAAAKLRLTRVGWLLICITVLVLIGGFSLQYLAPESLIGKLVNTPYGRLAYTLMVVGAFWLVEVALKAKGITVLKRDDRPL